MCKIVIYKLHNIILCTWQIKTDELLLSEIVKLFTTSEPPHYSFKICWTCIGFIFHKYLYDMECF